MSRADIYLTYLDRILAGEKDIGPVEDIELKKLLLLSRIMIITGFNVNSQTREKLQNKLLNLVKDKSGLAGVSSNDELDEEALEHVAAGFSDPVEAGKNKIH